MTLKLSLDRLTDQALLDQFGGLVQLDHRHTESLLRHIAEMDRRQLWAKYGHPSMFDFLVTRHHMSESTAGKRIGAARTARRFPILFEMVGRGEIHLSGIHRLKAHLTRENHEHVLARAKHQTIRQIEELVARLAPKPHVPSTLRALPSQTTPTNTTPTNTTPTNTTPTNTTAAPAPGASLPLTLAPVPPPASAPEPEPTHAPALGVPLAASRRAPDPVPLAPGRFRLQLTLSQATRDKLKQLQDLLAHQVPNGDPAVIIERAIDALLTQIYKRKTGITDKPRARKPKPRPNASARRTRAIEAAVRRPLEAAVRREVWTRDEGRCGFVGEDGHRCNETRGLQFAHTHPWGKGGADTARNLGLRCISHNAFEADRDYGSGFMASKREQKPLKVREPVVRYHVRRALQQDWNPHTIHPTAKLARGPSTDGPEPSPLVLVFNASHP